MNRSLPLVVVLGATACGKSKLAIELARRFNGEIISADSMQVYHGLDIVTNKVTEDEMKQAKHHMINIVDPLSRYSVVDFQSSALSIIDKLMQSGSTPIIVGGTNYYIESLVWKGFLLSEQTTHKESETLIDLEAQELKSIPAGSIHTEEEIEDVEKFFKKPIYHDGLKAHKSEKLWSILEKVDQKSAHRYHPNDRRKIIRCLQIIQRQHKNYSDLLQNRNISCEGDKPSLGGPLRYDPTCVLWLSCDEQVLNKILDERVDHMLEKGLLKELEDFHEEYNTRRAVENQKPDYTKGIFQTIGFKEFHSYLILDEQARSSVNGRDLLSKSIENMKCSTRRYARTQLKWIRSRFLTQGVRDIPPVFELKTAFNDDDWERQVRRPAFEIIDSFVQQKPLPDDLEDLKHVIIDKKPSFEGDKLFCEACDRLFIGSHDISSHLKSRQHKKAVEMRRRKRKKLVEEIELPQLADQSG